MNGKHTHFSNPVFAHSHPARSHKVLRMDRELPLFTRVKLRIHYLMCSFCERYEKQLKYMREVACEFPEKIGEVSKETMPEDVKQRMREALKL